LLQHIGVPAIAIVKPGDEVKAGQMIGESAGYVSSPVHASICGKIKGIKKYPVSMYKYANCIEIEANGEDTHVWRDTPGKWQDLSAEKLKDAIVNAGIVGMGGASFPTHVKLSPPKDKKIDFIIVNGVECEPYLDADRSIMVEAPERVLTGLQIAMKIVGCEQGYVGIESDTPDAIKIMTESAQKYKNIEVVGCELKYPQGAEKQLIYAVSGREVPSGGLPMDAGAIVINAGTASAIYDAVVYEKPLIERRLTIVGNVLPKSINTSVRIGTIISDLIESVGGFCAEPGKSIMGGPMMGEVLYSLDVPVLKGTSGLYFQTKEEAVKYKMLACIRCGRCVDICPAGISPAQICQAIEFGQYDLAEKLNIFDCIKCGCCTYVCPSNRELVQLIKLGEGQLRKKKGKKA
jgi:electron transport complex protein RnfC